MKRLIILIPAISAVLAFILANSSTYTRSFDIPASTMFAVAFENGSSASKTLQLNDERIERARFPLVIGFALVQEGVEQFVSIPSTMGTRAFTASRTTPHVDTGRSIIIFRSGTALRSFAPAQINVAAFPCTILGAAALQSYRIPPLLDPLLESLPRGFSFLLRDRPLVKECRDHDSATGRFASPDSSILAYSSGIDLLTWWVKTLNSVKEDEKIALLEDSKEIEKTCLEGMKFDEFLAETGPTATVGISAAPDGTWSISLAVCTRTPRAAAYMRNIAEKFISEANQEGGKFSLVDKNPNETVYDAGKGIEAVLGRKAYLFVSSTMNLFTTSIGTMKPAFKIDAGTWCDYELKIDTSAAAAALSKNINWIARYISRTDFSTRAEAESKKDFDSRLSAAAVAKMKKEIRDSLKGRISDPRDLDKQTELLLSEHIYNTRQEIITAWLDRFESSDEFKRALADTEQRFKIFLGLLTVPGNVTVLSRPARQK